MVKSHFLSPLEGEVCSFDSQWSKSGFHNTLANMVEIKSLCRSEGQKGLKQGP